MSGQVLRFPFPRQNEDAPRDLRAHTSVVFHPVEDPVEVGDNQ
jgi:hypothetical protein